MSFKIIGPDPSDNSPVLLLVPSPATLITLVQRLVVLLGIVADP
jgi:hypothetical protein